MKLIDRIKAILGLYKGYSDEDLASLCVLFGVSKEQLLDEYIPLTSYNFKNHDDGRK